MKGFRKMDEMEMSITVKAIRLSWLYSGLFLLVWICYDFITTKSFQWLPFILMTSQSLVYWIAQMYLKWKLGKDEE
ncbi:MAG: hypothetical protein GX222_01030 [Ruminococcaceae bacterium]|nr:hypothetical protein [Oscillospiraceae bacterium]